MTYLEKLTIGLTVLVFLVVMETEAYYQGRHVCHKQRNVTRPVPITQTYKRPVYRKDLGKMTYVTAYKTVFRMKMTTQMVKECCNGWEKRQYRDNNCMKPICTNECQNGGTCIAPELCMCPRGYAGYMCQIDIDECSGRHKCQQTCTNLPGSYECGCRNGFQLADDNVSCDLCLSCTDEFKGMQQQMDFMRNRILELEEEKESLKSNLTSALTQYEEAITAFSDKDGHLQDASTSPAYVDDGYDMQVKDKLMPFDRLASLSQQISILEEKMADCSCTPNYF